MSECHFWWRAGDTQWCDMQGNECHCHGWEESCDMKKAKEAESQARLVAHVDPAKVNKAKKPQQAA
ncbi:MAG: hypothetical protein K6U00_03980 [Armatimonadetes bacterium]|nr:hypothetical protein [Armatimonadota bacterium]